MTRRKSLSGKERLRLFTLHEGICHICGDKIQGGHEPWDIEHVNPLAMGGEDDDENRRPAHRKCHKGKTAEDVRHIAKSKRMQQREAGIKRQSSNPLPGGRDSPWRKTFNNGWERR